VNFPVKRDYADRFDRNGPTNASLYDFDFCVHLPRIISDPFADECRRFYFNSLDGTMRSFILECQARRRRLPSVAYSRSNLFEQFSAAIFYVTLRSLALCRYASARKRANTRTHERATHKTRDCRVATPSRSRSTFWIYESARFRMKYRAVDPHRPASLGGNVRSRRVSLARPAASSWNLLLGST